MKIDRFVKVMLVLIVLLLVFNCVNNFNNSSDSRGDTGSSISRIFESTVDAQSKKTTPTPVQVRTTQYKAVAVDLSYPPASANIVQQALNQQSAQGWDYVGEAGSVLIFKK
jgi:hypothetical protein